jgi:hypothetical protein
LAQELKDFLTVPAIIKVLTPQRVPVPPCWYRSVKKVI